MKIALVQFDIGDGVKDENLSRMSALLDQTKDADLIVLPELWNIGVYSFDRYTAEAETDDGETISMMRNKAEALGAYILTGTMIERDGKNLFNTAYLIDAKGEIVSKYRKIHLYSYNSREKELLTPGDKIVAANTRLGRFGLAICYDLRFPELFRNLLDKNAQLFLVPAAWPLGRLEHWRLFNCARAVENLSFLISSCCVGGPPGQECAGHSMVVDPWGRILVEGSANEEVLMADVELKDVERLRSEFSAVSDRVGWL